jgi:hypothetical protein
VFSILEETGNPPASLDSTAEDVEERFSDDDFDIRPSLCKGNVNEISGYINIHLLSCIQPIKLNK